MITFAFLFGLLRLLIFLAALDWVFGSGVRCQVIFLHARLGSSESPGSALILVRLLFACEFHLRRYLTYAVVYSIADLKSCHCVWIIAGESRHCS
jgi:hypothetical protein